jgi:hypothetical protein
MKMLRTFVLVVACGLAMGGRAVAGDDEPEAKIIERAHASMNELPRLVRETLEREATDGSLEELEKEYRADHSVTYHAEIVRAGTISYVQVSSDGTIIGRAKPPRLPTRANANK